VDISNFESTQCHHRRSDIGKIFDMQNRKFSTVTCSRCSYTKLYPADGSTLRNAFGLFTQ
jgi:predicted nucleic-acid-binding Zn-ribbon protein